MKTKVQLNRNRAFIRQKQRFYFTETKLSPPKIVPTVGTFKRLPEPRVASSPKRGAANKRLATHRRHAHLAPPMKAVTRSKAPFLRPIRHNVPTTNGSFRQPPLILLYRYSRSRWQEYASFPHSFSSVRGRW